MLVNASAIFISATIKIMKLVTAFLFLLIATSIGFAQSATQKAKFSADIKQVMDDQTTAWNRGELESFMSGYWRSDKLKFVSGDRITYGWQPTLDNYRKSYPTKELMGTLTFSDLDIQILSKDAAYVTGSWHLKREKDDPKGKFTLLWRKIASKWMIVSDHSS